ncbi:hypothetical protein XELAEV_18034830mg, partial [Xenopus laevis]
KCILASLIALAILVTTCSAGCFSRLPGESHGCFYRGELHDRGSKFRTKDCMDCTCSMDGSMRCCQAYGTPVKYDKEKCTAVFNRNTCLYNVVEKKNPSRECDILAMVG